MLIQEALDKKNYEVTKKLEMETRNKKYSRFVQNFPPKNWCNKLMLSTNMWICQRILFGI